MIVEALTWLVTPCPGALRRLGFLRESVALGARARRCRAAWAPHLARARAFVRDAIPPGGRHGRAVVLGSGALLDVPLAELRARFEEVVLVDAVHPWSARLAALRAPGVRLETHDLSGVAAALAADPAHPPPVPNAPLPFAGADFVVSANLLSQLPIVLHAAALGAGAAEPALEAFCRGLVRAHLDALAACPAPVCLVTDTAAVTRDRAGTEVARRDLLWGERLPAPDATWEWALAPPGEIDRAHAVVHEVAAFARYSTGE